MAILPANRTVFFRTKSLEKRPSRRLRAMPNKTLSRDGESKSVVLLHRIRLRLLNLVRHLGQAVVRRIQRRCSRPDHEVAHRTLREYQLTKRRRANLRASWRPLGAD